MKQIAFAALALAGIAGLAHAHHSFAQYYWEDRSVTIQGELSSFDYRNPHTWVHFTANDAQGISRQYAAEWSNPNRLERDNISKETLKPGDKVVVTGSPGKVAEEYKLHLKRIERPADGWTWPVRQGR